jgi:hypothetical protein
MIAISDTRFLLLMSTILFIISCSQKEATVSIPSLSSESSIPFPIPSLSDALNKEELALSEENGYQLRFNLEREYPNIDAIVFYENHYAKKEFRIVCENIRPWVILKAIDQPDSKGTNQIMISDNSNEIITVIIRYFYKNKSNRNDELLKQKQEVIVSLFQFEESDFSKINHVSNNACF